MWYKFIKGEPLGKLKVNRVQTCWYDWESSGDCFDESWTMPGENDVETLKEIGMRLPYVGTVEGNGGSRVFIHMDDGDVYELLLNKLSKEQHAECNNFFGGRINTESNKDKDVIMDAKYQESTGTFVCPACGASTLPLALYGGDYCQHCGQHVRWSGVI